MIEKLPSFFKDPHVLAGTSENEGVLVALSGGADSSALLHLLCNLRKKKSFPLYAAHVNHNIRTELYGNEAARDEDFCRELCAKMGVELFVHSANVPTVAESEGKSLEAAARDVRYEFFASIMKQKGIRILATAHNADDNFETQLFNLCRGCGIEGICGIPETRFLDGEGERIAVRPILSATKQEIFELCDAWDIQYVTDSTNFEDDCTRNKLRLNIIPQLKEIFGTPEKSGARLATSAKEDSDFILSEAARFMSECGGGISQSKLCALHPSVAKRAIRIGYERSFSASLERVHVEDVLRFASTGKNGSISLPHGALAVFEDRILTFRSDVVEEKAVESYKIALSEGFTPIDGTFFAVCVTKNGSTEQIDESIYTPYASAYVNVDIGALYAANRKEGDVILDGGVHKRVKKLMCDKKVPRSDRSSLPLILADDEIVYVPLCAVSDGIRAKKNNFELKISIYKKS